MGKLDGLEDRQNCLNQRRVDIGLQSRDRRRYPQQSLRAAEKRCADAAAVLNPRARG